MGVGSTLIGAGLGLLVLATSSVAQAGDRVRLEWIRGEGADECPSGATMAAEITRRLGRDPFASDAAVAIEVALRREGTAWTAHIQARGESGAITAARDLRSEAPTCASLASAVALAVALTIDPEAGQAPAPAPVPVSAPVSASVPVSVPVPVPVPVSAPVRAPVSAPAPAPSVRSVWVARLDVTRGLLPHVSPGPALVGRFEIRAPVSIAAGIRWLPDGSTSDGAFAFGMTSGWVGPCVDALRRGPVALGLCWNLLAGEIHAVVEDTRQADPGGKAWFATSGSAHATWRFADPVGAELGLEALAPLGPYELDAKGCDVVVFRQTSLVGIVSLGVAMTFH